MLTLHKQQTYGTYTIPCNRAFQHRLKASQHACRKPYTYSRVCNGIGIVICLSRVRSGDRTTTVQSYLGAPTFGATRTVRCWSKQLDVNTTRVPTSGYRQAFCQTVPPSTCATNKPPSPPPPACNGPPRGLIPGQQQPRSACDWHGASVLPLQQVDEAPHARGLHGGCSRYCSRY